MPTGTGMQDETCVSEHENTLGGARVRCRVWGEAAQGLAASGGPRRRNSGPECCSWTSPLILRRGWCRGGALGGSLRSTRSACQATQRQPGALFTTDARAASSIRMTFRISRPEARGVRRPRPNSGGDPAYRARPPPGRLRQMRGCAPGTTGSIRRPGRGCQKGRAGGDQGRADSGGGRARARGE